MSVGITGLVSAIGASDSHDRAKRTPVLRVARKRDGYNPIKRGAPGRLRCLAGIKVESKHAGRGAAVEIVIE